MTKYLRILLLEDNPADAELVEFELKEAGLAFTLKVATTEKEYLQAIDGHCPDLILSDYDLPSYNGALALAEANRRCPDTPFILVSGAITEDRAIEILTQGAKDYILKNRLQQRLAPAVRRSLAETEALRARKQAEADLREAHKTLEEKVAQRTAKLEAEMAARKKIEAALRESEGRLRKLYQESPIPTVTWQKKGRDFTLIDVNHAAIGLSGGRIGEFLGRSAAEMYKSRPYVLWDMNLCYKNRSPISREITSLHFAPGKCLSVHYGFIPPDFIIAHMVDRTESRQAEEALKRERDLLQAVMASAGIAHLVYLDRDFNFVRVNETYAASCGYRPAEMIGKNHFALYPDAENEAIFVQVRDTGQPVAFHDKPFVFPDQPNRGVTYWDWTLVPVKDRSGVVSGLIFSLYETTERKIDPGNGPET